MATVRVVGEMFGVNRFTAPKSPERIWLLCVSATWYNPFFDGSTARAHSQLPSPSTAKWLEWRRLFLKSNTRAHGASFQPNIQMAGHLLCWVAMAIKCAYLFSWMMWKIYDTNVLPRTHSCTAPCNVMCSGIYRFFHLAIDSTARTHMDEFVPLFLSRIWIGCSQTYLLFTCSGHFYGW